MKKHPDLGWAAAYIGKNEIYTRVGRNPIHSESDIQACISEAHRRKENREQKKTK